MTEMQEDVLQRGHLEGLQQLRRRIFGQKFPESHHTNNVSLQSISPTFYDQLLSLFPSTKKLQIQTETTFKLRKTLLYEKSVHKMLVKLTPIINFINILQSAFELISFYQKITNPNCKYIKAA